MKHLYLLIFISLVSANEFEKNNCTIKGHVMNCTGLKLTDCPEVDGSIQNLILDFNLLTTLSTNSCRNLTQLHKLSIQSNSLTSSIDFKDFIFLNSTSLRGNQLTDINIDADSIIEIDISSNRLTQVDVGTPIYLSQLNVSHNSLDEKGISSLIKLLHVSTKITVLDLSHNQMKAIPIEFSTFSPLNLISLNIAVNKLSVIDFSSFKPSLGNNLSLNLSRNMITRCIVSEKRTIRELDLSYNKLQKIDADHLDRLKGLAKLDISGNPLNCLCNESAAFIDWLQRHEKILIHKKETTCAQPPSLDLDIFNITCSQSTTTSSPSPTSHPSTSASTTKTSASSSTPSVSTDKPLHSSTYSSSTKTSVTSSTPPVFTEKPPVSSNGWKVAVGVILSLFAIVLILFAGRCYCKQERHGYTILGGSRNLNMNMACNCFPWASMGSRRRSNLVIDPEQDSQPIFDENHSEVNNTLNIICSSQETEWLKNSIVDYLDVNVQFIDSAVVRLPRADFTLIFVNGDSSLRDNVFIENVKLVLLEKDQSDIKLLFNSIPDFNKLTTKTVNEATKYIRNNIQRRGHSLEWDISNKASCLLALKSWLQSTNDLQNV